MRIMKQLLVGAACAALVLSATACGDDSDDNTGYDYDSSDNVDLDTDNNTDHDDDHDGDDHDDDHDGDDNSGDDTTGDDTTGDDTTAATGACTNDADQAIMGTDEGYANAVAVATSAAIACLTDADIATCVGNQVVADTGLSAECSGCFVEQVICSVQECIAVCAPPNEGSEACSECRAENCLPLWEPCSGVPTSTGE